MGTRRTDPESTPPADRSAVRVADDADPLGGAAESGLALLRRQIHDLQLTLAALRAGGVDAVVLGEPGEEQVWALTAAADLPYRVIVENMGEGSATVSGEGIVLFANRQLSTLLGRSQGSLVGQDLAAYVAEEHLGTLGTLLSCPAGETMRAEVVLHAPDGDVPALVAATGLELEDDVVRCLVFTDLTMQRRIDEEAARAAEENRKRRERERLAHDVNDTIVQHLVTAEMALDLGHLDKARELVSATSRRARAYIGELVEGGRLQPGMAVRSRPAGALDDADPDS